MPPKPKVPFTLHDAMCLKASIGLPDASRVSLGPGGSLAVVRRTGAFGGALDLYDRPDAKSPRSLDAPEKGWWDSVCWSRDGSRWAAAQERWEATARRGRVVIGEASSAAALYDVDVSGGAPITINHQGQSAPLIALSADQATLAWRGTSYERPEITLVDAARGSARTHALPAGEHDLFAHAYSDDGGLYTVSSDISARGGTARWNPTATAPERRWDWAAGCALVPAREGVWVLGVNGVVWRLGPGRGGPFVAETERRLQRARDLRARATHKWDVAFLDHQIARIEKDERTFCWETNTPRARWGTEPEAMEGARCFDVDLLWECGAASRFGDDAAVLTDGVSVMLLRERGDRLSRVVLLDDEERCSPRVRRIVDVTAAGATVGVLWKKSATSVVLSLFDVDPRAG